MLTRGGRGLKSLVMVGPLLLTNRHEIFGDVEREVLTGETPPISADSCVAAKAGQGGNRATARQLDSSASWTGANTVVLRRLVSVGQHCCASSVIELKQGVDRSFIMMVSSTRRENSHCMVPSRPLPMGLHIVMQYHTQRSCSNLHISAIEN